MVSRLCLFLGFLVLAAAPVTGRAAETDIEDIYGDIFEVRPSADHIVICHGFGCQHRVTVALEQSDLAALARLFKASRVSAAAERRSVALAAAWFDRKAGPAAGTVGRIAYAGPKVANDPRQMDCVDISHNNTSLFMVLEDLGLLLHHKVEHPAGRGALIDGVLPHATAVLREVHDNRKWAFDSWTRRYGELPEVMTLDRWMTDESR